MKRFNRVFALCLTLSVLGGAVLPSPWTCGGFTEPATIEVYAEGEPTTIDSGIGVLITMLLANGIRFVGNFDTTVKPGIEKLWNDFTTATGNTVTLATLGAQSVVQLGYLRTSSAVNNAVTAFQHWYQNTFSVPASGTVDVPAVAGNTNYVTLDGCIHMFTANYRSYNAVVSAPVRAVAFKDGDAYRFGWMSDQPFKYGIVNDSNGSWSCPTNPNIDATGRRFNGVLYYYYWNYNATYPQAWGSSYANIPVINTYGSVDDIYRYTYGAEAGLPDVIMQGDSLNLVDGYDVSNDQAKLYDLAGIENLVGTLGLTLDNITDLVDSIPLIMDYPWADTYPADPAFADTPDDAIPWVDVPTAVVPAEVPEYVPETPADEGSYKVLGLERVFPFSIPFDFIAVVNLLNADPVCPEFTFRIYNPISGQNIDAVMSFQQFESVAQVLRIVETLGFIVFLILITRSLIRS